MQDFFSSVAFRAAEQDDVSYNLEVELYANDALHLSASKALDKEKTDYTFKFSDIPLGSTVYAKAWIDEITVRDGQTFTEQLVYGESQPIKIETSSVDIPLKLKWVEKQNGVDDNGYPIIEITVSALKSAIQNYEAGTYTIYKVKGQMTNDDYDEIANLVIEKQRTEWDWKRYVGLDLSEVTGLTKVINSYYFSSLKIPNTITNFYFDLLISIQIRSDNPYFVWDDGVLYSKDKTILYLYSPDKSGETFEIPSGVKSIYPFAFEEANELKEIIIPESVIDIGFRAFYKKRLIFKDKENWISDITGKVLTAEELENPDNFDSIDKKTFITGICRNGIYKPVIKTVAVEELEEAINSAEQYIHTIFKVTGQMDTQAYDKFSKIVRQKGGDEEWPHEPKGYIGFDLTDVTGLTEISSVGDYVFSVAIPETISDISNINPISLAKITNLADNPNFAYEDGILYSNDKTILYSYSRTKEDTSFTIPSTVTIVCNMAFYANFFIQNITIPSSVFYIGEEAFEYTNIKTFTFEDTEGWFLYYDDTPLTKSDIENPANYIWDHETQTKGICLGGIYKPQIENITVTASELIEKLKNYEPEMNVYTIYKVTGAMTYNDYYQAFEIPWEKLNNREWEDKYVGLDLSEAEGLTKIGGTWCFRTVIIPDTVEEIEDYSSGNIVGLESNPNFKYVNDILYTKDGTTLCFYPGDKTEESFTIPSTVTRIWSYAFYYNYNLKNITIPESVLFIGTYAFSNNLVNLTFADTNNWYSNNGNHAISESDLKNPANYSWDYQAQTNRVCALGIYKRVEENLIVTASELITALNSHVAGVYTIYKVTGAMTYDDYYQAFLILWNKFDGHEWEEKYVGLDLSEVEGLTRIGATWCFSTVIIPNTVTSMDNYSGGNIVGFESNPNFKYVDDVLYSSDGSILCYYPKDKTDETFVIPSGVKNICTYAFYYNNFLKNLTIPEDVISIDGYAFSNNLVNLTFADTNNWYSNNTNQLISENDLKNPVNYSWDEQTQTSGVCSSGIYKVQNQTKTVTVSELTDEINSYEVGVYTNYQVTGTMSNNDYDEIINLISNKQSSWNYKLYVALDLSAVSGLTAISSSSGLRSLIIPDSVSTVDDWIDLSNITVSNNNPYFEYENGSLYSEDKTILYSYSVDNTDESFTIPSTVTKIWSFAFCHNTSIKNITILSNVIFIGTDAFRNKNIQTLTFQNKDNWMSKNNYYGNAINVSAQDLETVQNYQIDGNGVGGLLQNSKLFIPQSITVTASELITSLNSYVAGTYTIYKVTGDMTYQDYNDASEFIWNKVNNGIWNDKYVGFDLSEVTELTRIGVTWCLLCLVIPDTVTEISDFTLDVILNLNNHPNFPCIDGVIYTKDMKTLCSYMPDKTDASFIIPSYVTIIHKNAFSYNDNIKNITIPESVTYIEGWAFDSSSIETLTFADKDGWKKIEDDQSVSVEDLENPDNYRYDGGTGQNGPLIQGVYK